MILEETFDTGKYQRIISKQVMDSDGFYTDYTMYYNPDEDNYFFMFGDEDVYGPDPYNADWTCDTNDEATEWYNNYNGFEDEDLDEDLEVAIPEVTPAEDIEVVAEVEPSKETATIGPDVGVAGLINNLIIQNWQLNSAYTDLIVNADSNNNQKIAELAKDIVAEINNHIGRLQTALSTISPNVENISAGESEAARQLNNVNEELTEKEHDNLERTGKINERIRRKLNSIVNRYNGWQDPSAIGKMFGELADEGVDVTVMGPPQDYAPGAKSWTVPWELDGVRVENSMFVYSVYEGGETPRNEYNMYFS